MAFVEVVDAFVRFVLLHELFRNELKTIGELEFVVGRLLPANAQTPQHAIERLTHEIKSPLTERHVIIAVADKHLRRALLLRLGLELLERVLQPNAVLEAGDGLVVLFDLCVPQCYHVVPYELLVNAGGVFQQENIPGVKLLGEVDEACGVADACQKRHASPI